MRLLLLNLDPTDRPDDIRPLGQLEVICSRYELQVTLAAESPQVPADGFDALIVAGGLWAGEMPHSKWHDPVVKLIQESGRPVLGIGLGFELVCAAYDVDLAGLGEIAPGAPVITPTEDGSKLFQGTDPLRVNERARWCVEADALPKALRVLATSETGVEAIQHKTLPAYGLQVYPEDFTYPTDGKLVYENILSAMQKAAPAAPAAQPA